jgi:AcrR family transcriptional regulator
MTAAVEHARLRAKEQTRARIAEVALDLFRERGFDRVRTADVAAAAGVTEKTVFNHFPTKEDLVYPDAAPFEAALLATVGAGEGSVVGRAERFFREFYARFPRETEAQRRATALATIVEGSETLQIRELVSLTRIAARLGDAIRATTAAPAGDLRPVVLAEAILAIHRAALAAFRRGLLAGEDAQTLATRVTAQTADAFRLLAQGADGRSA